MNRKLTIQTIVICAAGLVCIAVGIIGLFVIPADSMAGKMLLGLLIGVALGQSTWLLVIAMTAVAAMLPGEGENEPAE